MLSILPKHYFLYAYSVEVDSVKKKNQRSSSRLPHRWLEAKIGGLKSKILTIKLCLQKAATLKFSLCYQRKKKYIYINIYIQFL